jgi:hypothetical protein
MVPGLAWFPSDGHGNMCSHMERAGSEFERVERLATPGLSDHETAARTGLPRVAVQHWRHRSAPPRIRNRFTGAEEWRVTDPAAYCYLLGVYLGDGSLRRWGPSWILRISLDAAYPGIIADCCDAIERLRPGRRPAPKPEHDGKKWIHVESTWRAWPDVLPQRGPGRRHRLKVELADWQQDLVDAAPGAFLRGLIHADGWRGVNRVHVRGKDYEYPRYQFSNRSDDIRRLFTDACEKLGVQWRPWTRYDVSVARQKSVAILDEYVGPKR